MTAVEKTSAWITQDENRILERIREGEVFAVERSVLVNPEHDNPVCICGFDEGPEETCLFHGRSKLEWMNRHGEALDRANALEIDLASAEEENERLAAHVEEQAAEIEKYKRDRGTHENRITHLEYRLAEAGNQAEHTDALRVRLAKSNERFFVLLKAHIFAWETIATLVEGSEEGP